MKGITSYLYGGNLIHESWPGESEACLGVAYRQVLLKLPLTLFATSRDSQQITGKHDAAPTSS